VIAVDILTNTMGNFTASQELALVVVPTVSGILSLLSSLYIIVIVAKSTNKRGKVYHRLLFGMSVCDFLVSLGFVFSKWPVPIDSDTNAMCNAQGFFIQLSLAVVLYNLSLATYYLLVVRYEWKENRLQKIEPYMHASALIVGLSTSLAGVFLELYNPAILWCWIASFPEGCNGEECKRGQHAVIYRWAIFYGPIWVAIFAAAAIMCAMYLTVRKQETLGNRHVFHGAEAKRKYSTKVAFQGLLYVGAFFITYVPASIARLAESISATNETNFFLVILFAITLPLQGFMNFVVYIYPRTKNKRNGHRQSSKCAAVWAWFTSIFFDEGEDEFTSEATVQSPLLQE